ncbi:MAG: SDR family oxidoreductase [Caulobacteraceae bacterium]
MGRNLFIYGYGFTGAALARRLRADGWTAAGTSRSPEGRTAMATEGVRPVDPADAEALRRALGEADALLVAAPPGVDGCPAFNSLSQLLSRERPSWTGYLSTTGVYGDREGRWVFETSDLAARSLEGARRVEAERNWRRLGRDLDMVTTVFRLPGIYGPGRSPFDRLREGGQRRIVKPGHVFSRVHVDDIAAGLAASIARPRAGGIYNLCDDEPAPAADVTAYAAAMLGMEPPPEVAWDEAVMAPAARRFYAESKRVSNARAKAELGWRPAYPSYREGLAAILAGEQATGRAPTQNPSS